MKKKPSLALIDKGVLCMLAAAFVLALSMLLNSCRPIEWLNDNLKIEDDAPIEEFAEDIIEHHTSVGIDLTPRSPE